MNIEKELEDLLYKYLFPDKYNQEKDLYLKQIKLKLKQINRKDYDI